jgi:ComF family protein
MSLGTAEVGAKGARGWLIDAILPPRCLGCGITVDVQGRVCPACFARLTFVAPPVCARCGVPFPVPAPPDTLCGACLAEPPDYDVASSALVYGDGARDLVLGFKHGDRTHGAATFAAWMTRAGAALLDQADVLVPVPLHRSRLFTRRYNQAALLAQAVGRVTGLPVAVDALRRRHDTPSQGTLNRAARRANVERAFAVRRAGAVTARRVVLIDDVMTTGATADACARTLLKAGAGWVGVLTLAHAVRADP